MQSNNPARYLDVLHLTGVKHTFFTSLIGRAAYALVHLPLFYAVAEGTGSIGVAGAVLALFGASASFLAPVRAALIDRFGPRRVLSWLIAGFICGLVGLAGAAQSTESPAIFLLLAVFAGSTAPPLGPTMRVAWAVLCPAPAALKKGLSFDAVVEELLYLTGPAVAGIVIATTSPSIALLLPAMLLLIGGPLFLTSPVLARAKQNRPIRQPQRASSDSLRNRRFVGLLLPVLVAGATSGALSIVTPLALSNHGGATAAGVALGLFAGGSAVGGLLFGTLRVPGSPVRQLLIMTAALIGLSTAASAVAGLLQTATMLAAAGLFFSPIMVVAYLAAHSQAGSANQNAATTWVNTAHNLGSAAAIGLVGALLEHLSTNTTMLLLAGVSFLLLVVAAWLSVPSATIPASPVSRRFKK